MNFLKFRKSVSAKGADMKSPRKQNRASEGSTKCEPENSIHVDSPCTKPKHSPGPSPSLSKLDMSEALAKASLLDKYSPQNSTANWLSDTEPAPDSFELKRLPPITDSDLPECSKLESFCELELSVRAMNSSVFDHIDQHALRIAGMEFDTFRELMWALIYARSITDELEKARAIYIWLCARDVKKWQFRSAPPGSPEEILVNRTTYAQTFTLICSYAGLKSAIVTGYAKGADYEPGMHFVGRHGSHAWNAVFAHEQWHLIDCHWSARKVAAKSQKDGPRIEMDTFYFFAIPSQLIYSHFPEKSHWQLLPNPITLAEFESFPPLKSSFFKHGLELESHKGGVIESDASEVQITIRVKKNPSEVAFTFTVVNDVGFDEQHWRLSQYGMNEVEGNTVYFHLRLPEMTTYKVVIYAKRVVPILQPSEDDVSLANKETYSAVCEYKVIATTKPEKKVFPYPPCQNSCYGPNELASRFSVVASQKESVIKAPNGVAEVRFQLTRPLRFMPKIRTYVTGLEDGLLDRCCVVRLVDLELRISVFCPDKGEFGLEIYGNDPKIDGNTLYHIWQYLIVSETASSTARILPHLPAGSVGAQNKFGLFGLSVLNFNDPFIQTRANEHNLQFGMQELLRTTIQLSLCEPGKEPEDLTNFVLQQCVSKDTKLHYMLRLPKIGIYKFQLFAIPANDLDEALPNVYTYLIEVQQAALPASKSNLPFPKQLSLWKDGCYLFEPLDGPLKVNQYAKGNVSFKVLVPGAQACSVVIGEEWIAMENNGEGEWSVQINVAKHRAKSESLKICANYGSYKASYSTLLEYSI